MANKVKIQTYLSESSHERVVKFQSIFKNVGVTISDSEAVNALIEMLCKAEAENIELATQLRMNSIMKMGEK